jgi:hypothetical protein
MTHVLLMVFIEFPQDYRWPVYSKILGLVRLSCATWLERQQVRPDSNPDIAARTAGLPPQRVSQSMTEVYTQSAAAFSADNRPVAHPRQRVPTNLTEHTHQVILPHPQTFGH